MAKEEDLKVIELKVSANCCEGCKKKVVKALSIKGLKSTKTYLTSILEVLKAEIHPTLPKVTVIGSADVVTLVKKLAKCGKTAEVLRVESKKLEAEAVKINSEAPKKETRTECSSEKDCAEKSKGKKKSSSSDSEKAHLENTSNSNDNTIKCKSETKGTKESKEIINEACAPDFPKSVYPTVVTTIPPANYVVDQQGAMQSSPTMITSHARVFYPMEQQQHTLQQQPKVFYALNSYSVPHPSCSIRDHCCHCEATFHRPQQQQTNSQSSGFGDYFNDDNTAGCCVM